MNAIVPIPQVAVSVRPATLDDLPFLDQLQKQHNKALGYFPTKQFEGYIEMGAVLMAEHADEPRASASDPLGPLPDGRGSFGRGSLGYVISRDRYLKRDELGVVYQLCVAPGEQRKLIGAALVREVFARSAYGCKLYCCWCAQDLSANRFWESMGFLPIAFRAGSSGKRRVHIFWQKRINDGDVSTPWWYPCATNAGAIREDRLVFPIPPGTHWKDVSAVAHVAGVPGACLEDQTRNTGRRPVPQRTMARKSVPQKKTPSAKQLTSASCGMRFGPAEPPVSESPAKPKREKQPNLKFDPKLVRAARELRDRYLERVNSSAAQLGVQSKYDVSRALPAPAPASQPAPEAAQIRHLPHAA